jgi:hypothetical protein
MYTNPYFFTKQGHSVGSQLSPPSTQTMADRNIQQIANPMPQGQPRPQSNFNVGAAANAIGGAAALVGGAIGQANQQLGINTQMAPMQTDQFSKPVYTGGGLSNQISAAKPQGATGGEVLSGVGTGASVGTSILPGWGTLIGAAVGAGASLIGGGVRKKRQRRERSRAQGKLNQAQSQYNAADIGYRNRQAAQEDYLQKQDESSRMYNLYRNQY